MPFQGGFDEAPHRAFGYVVVKAVKDEATPAQVGAEELAVIHVAGEALIIPDDQPSFGRLARTEVAHHILKALAPNHRRTRAGGILEDLSGDQTMRAAPPLEFGFLTGNGELLLFATRVATVKSNPCTRMVRDRFIHLLLFFRAVPLERFLKEV